MGIEIDISPRALHIHYAVSHTWSIVERHRRMLPSARTAIQQGGMKCPIRIEKGDYGFSIVAIEDVAVYGGIEQVRRQALNLFDTIVGQQLSECRRLLSLSAKGYENDCGYCRHRGFVQHGDHLNRYTSFEVLEKWRDDTGSD